MNKDAARYFSYLAIIGGIALALVTVLNPTLNMYRDSTLVVAFGVLALWLQNEAKA